MRVLVVDDEQTMADYLKSALTAECYEVDVANDGPTALELALTNEYDLILLDLILPGMNGEEVCAAVRKEGLMVPIIILSVKSDVDDKVTALQIGADDYLEKPFSIHELTARMQAVLRRPTKLKGQAVEVGDLKIDLIKREVSRAGKRINLTGTEYRLLAYLAENAGSVISKEKLLEKVCDANADLFSNSMNVHIFNLRRKVDKGFDQQLIHTVQGQGYKLELIKN
jgi:DNA-binding response OmpR family regulator